MPDVPDERALPDSPTTSGTPAGIAPTSTPTTPTVSAAERPGEEEPRPADEAGAKVALLALLGPAYRPPPDFRDVVRVPVDEEGPEIELPTPNLVSCIPLLRDGRVLTGRPSATSVTIPRLPGSTCTSFACGSA